MHRQARERRGVDRVDARRDLAALRGEARSGARVCVVAEDPARNGLAFDAVHDESPSEVVLGAQQHAHAGDGDSGGRGGLEQEVLG